MIREMKGWPSSFFFISLSMNVMGERFSCLLQAVVKLDDADLP